DVGSRNGTFVNDNPVSQKELENGDVVKFGEIQMRFAGPGKSKTSSTRVIASVDPDKTTITMPAAKGLPAWAFGLIGFAAVAIIFAGLYLTGLLGGKDDNGAEAAELQDARIWSVELGHKDPSTPLLADINNDGFLDVMVATIEGVAFAIDGEEGKRIFEANVSGRVLAPPVAGDLTGDGVNDVIVAGTDGIVTAFNGKGRILWQSSGDLDLGEIINRPVLSNINDDDIVDVIVPATGRGLVALDGSRGWPLWDTAELISGKTITTPLVADLNNDGRPDFVAVTDTGQVLAVSSRQGEVWKLWEAKVPDVHYASPLFIKTEAHSLVIVATDGGGIKALNAENGDAVWSASINKRFFASPLGSDANGNGFSDVVLVAENGDIHVLDGQNGEEIWSGKAGAEINASPALMDLNNNGLADLILLDKSGRMHVRNITDGQEMLNVKLSQDAGFSASPLLGDINNDELLNIITVDENGLLAVIGLNRPLPKGKALWPVFLGNDMHGL
ncbi:MAG: PQQ-binding-like beta-propeller repeat protein, partial [Marinobacter sp.]